MSFFFCHCDKILDKSNFRENKEGFFFLVNSFWLQPIPMGKSQRQEYEKVGHIASIVEKEKWRN